mmetsp:Transcript_47171/g.75760  ORF Transcript_47171/g.75760 Transcript_47171/m.75760 type:complete len:360 (-) Transcript_47171:90-1169(-)
MLPNVQTFNFVILMIFFMGVLWMVKVVVRVRKLYRLYNALNRNVVIRLDGEVDSNQHLDAISLSHMQQILNANLTQTSTPVPEVRTFAHVEPKTIRVLPLPSVSSSTISTETKRSSSNSSSSILRFHVSSDAPSQAAVYFGPIKESLRDWIKQQKTISPSQDGLHSARRRRMRRTQHHLKEEELKSLSRGGRGGGFLDHEAYLTKESLKIAAGVEVKAEVKIGEEAIAKCLQNHVSRFMAVIHTTSATSSLNTTNVGDEITIIRFSMKSSENERVISKLVGIQTDMQCAIATGKQPVHIREIFGEDEGGECLVCLSEPRDTILLPCRHMCTCRECLLKMVTAKCPICRTTIQRHVSFIR